MDDLVRRYFEVADLPDQDFLRAGPIEAELCLAAGQALHEVSQDCLGALRIGDTCASGT
jgi:hypothetical protein